VAARTHRVEDVKERHADVERDLCRVIADRSRRFVVDAHYVLFDAVLVRVVAQILVRVDLHYRLFARFSRALVHLLLVLQR